MTGVLVKVMHAVPNVGSVTSDEGMVGCLRVWPLFTSQHSKMQFPLKLKIFTRLWSFHYRVTMGSAAWLGPNRPRSPLPTTPVRPMGLLVRGKKKYRFTIFFKQDKGRFHDFASLYGLVSG